MYRPGAAACSSALAIEKQAKTTAEKHRQKRRKNIITTRACMDELSWRNGRNQLIAVCRISQSSYPTTTYNDLNNIKSNSVICA